MAASRSTTPTPSRPSPPRRLVRSGLLLGGLFVLVAVAVAFARVEWERAEARRAGREAVTLAQHGRFREAEPKLRTALEYDPDNCELLRALALGLLRVDNREKAEPILTHWCNVSPDQAEPFRHRMDLRHRSAVQTPVLPEQQRLKELALEDGRRVIELDPGDSSTASKVAWLLLASSQFEEADRVCRRFVARHPEDAEWLFLHARACHALNAHAEAQGLLKSLLARQPQFTPGLLLLAILHYESDESELAIPLLRRVIADSGGAHKEARYHLGLALARAGQTEEAQRWLADVQRENLDRDTAGLGERESLAVRVRRAELLWRGGRADEALVVLRTVLDEDPAYAPAHGLLAAYYSQKGEPAKAAEHQRRAGLAGVRR